MTIRTDPTVVYTWSKRHVELKEDLNGSQILRANFTFSLHNLDNGHYI